MIYWLRFSIYSWVKAAQHIEIEISSVILDLDKSTKITESNYETLAGKEEINFGPFIRSHVLDINLCKG